LWAILGTAHGASRFVVTSGKTKCYSVEVPKETTIKITYEAPDIDVDTTSKRYAPTYITVVERPIDTIEDQRLEHATDAKSEERRRAAILERTKKRPKPASQEITEYAGSFLHTIHSEDAIVDVCVRASKAGQKNPMMFHFRVDEMEEDVLDAFEQEKANMMRVPLVGVEHHWSFMETQLDRIEHEMHTIIREADFFRERDAIFHRQTDDLHKATLFWPILHCCILLLTGFTQANHIISFFKQHRII